MSANYYVPVGMEERSIEVKKSRFIACGTCVSTREQAMQFLAQMKQRYPDARHYCWAYLLGNPASASSAAMSDDGEPSGTAGKPILHVIGHKKIGDLMVVVVRYFGGVKLGAGGLTRAYSAATENLLSGMAVSERVAKICVRVSLSFAQENSFRHWCDTHRTLILSVCYDAHAVVLDIELPQAEHPALTEFCSRGDLRLEALE